jgi:hypothetical protein
LFDLTLSVLNFTFKKSLFMSIFITAYKLSLQEATNGGLKVSRMTEHVIFADNVTHHRHKQTRGKD